MSQEPRDTALAAISRATVRVADGSGFVIRNGNMALVATAAHVVRDGEIHPVRKGGVFGECPVLCRDEDLDVALVTPPAELEASALDVADSASDALPGDRIWGAGFPRGWKGSDPVVALGTVAGVGEQSWVNLDGTWGNSGGPLCRIQSGRALVTGILLGNAANASKDLNEWARIFRKDAADTRIALERLRTGRAALTKEAVAEMAKPLKLDSAAGELDVDSLAVQIRLLATAQALGNAALADLIDQHFRTGFLRFAPVSDLRKLLDTGDGRPAL